MIAAVWIIQRVVQHYANAKAEASDDPRTSVGVLAGSMLGRGWLDGRGRSWPWA